jgi:hypothetical protein
MPKRWRLERTFGWYTGYRRLAKDFEESIESASNVVMIAQSMVLKSRGWQNDLGHQDFTCFYEIFFMQTGSNSLLVAAVH